VLANVLNAQKVWRLYIEGVLNGPGRVTYHCHCTPPAAILRRWRTVSTRGGETVDGKVPNVLVHAGAGQGNYCSRPILVDDYVSTAVPPPIHPQDCERIGRRIVGGPGWIDYQWKRLMGQLATDVSGAHIGAYSLDPCPESDSWKSAIVAARDAVPSGYSDVLHDVIDIARAADPRQMGNDVAPHPFDGHHYLIDLDRKLGRIWGPDQRHINTGCCSLILPGTTCPDIETHGLHHFENQNPISSGVSIPRRRLGDRQNRRPQSQQSYTNYCQESLKYCQDCGTYFFLTVRQEWFHATDYSAARRRLVGRRRGCSRHIW
jgi:hypothetical protein